MTVKDFLTKKGWECDFDDAQLNPKEKKKFYTATKKAITFREDNVTLLKQRCSLWDKHTSHPDYYLPF